MASASPGWGGVYLDADVVVLRLLSGLQNAIEEAACARRRGEVKRHARGGGAPSADQIWSSKGPGAATAASMGGRPR